MQPLDGSETLVIDCSVAMAWYFKDEADPSYSDAVRAALATGRAAVPALWPLEVANVLLMGERRKRSTQAQAAKWLRLLAALPIAADPQAPHLAFDPILGLARSHKLTTYDAAYLELAIRLGLPLAARDAALEQAALGGGRSPLRATGCYVRSRRSMPAGASPSASPAISGDLLRPVERRRGGVVEE